MDTIRGDDSIKVVDVRSALKVSASTMSTIMKKCGYNGRSLNGAQARNVLSLRGYKYPVKTKIISFLIFKGGTAKTTSSKFVGERLASYGNKVLLLDADPQSNLTKSFKLDLYNIKLTPEDPVLADILDKKVNIKDAILPLTNNLHLIPSTPINSKCDNVIRDNYKNPAKPLRSLLKGLNDYEYIIIDCGPSLSITNTAAIGASDQIILPVDPDDFSQIGIDQTLSEIEDIKSECHLDQDIETRLFLTKFDEREYLSITILSELRKNFKDKVFKTHIRRSTDLKNSIHANIDLFSLPRSRAKEDYDELTREIMRL